MGGHGHGHEPHEPYVVPPASTYKLEDAPELVKYQKKLQKAGLTDPWIRNYIWSYHKKYGTRSGRLLSALFKGVPLGAGLFVVTLGIEKYFGIDWHWYMHADGHGDHGKSH